MKALEEIRKRKKPNGSIFSTNEQDEILWKKIVGLDCVICGHTAIMTYDKDEFIEEVWKEYRYKVKAKIDFGLCEEHLEYLEVELDGPIKEIDQEYTKILKIRRLPGRVDVLPENFEDEDD